MKILSEEEASEIIPLKPGKYTWLYKEMLKLKIGQAIVIANEDWKTKTPPYKTIRTAAKTLKMTFDYGRMPDESGWIVKRIK